MIVKSAPGTRCPKEGKPKEYITDQAAVEVPDSAYYIRLVADGSLVPLEVSVAGPVRDNGNLKKEVEIGYRPKSTAISNGAGKNQKTRKKKVGKQ